MKQRDLRAELLQAEATHFAKKNGVPVDTLVVENAPPKRQLEAAPPGGDDAGGAGEIEEDPEAKRRRILEETRDIDADSDGSEDDSSEEERYTLFAIVGVDCSRLTGLKTVMTKKTKLLS